MFVGVEGLGYAVGGIIVGIDQFKSYLIAFDYMTNEIHTNVKLFRCLGVPFVLYNSDYVIAVCSDQDRGIKSFILVVWTIVVKLKGL